MKFRADRQTDAYLSFNFAYHEGLGGVIQYDEYDRRLKRRLMFTIRRAIGVFFLSLVFVDEYKK